MMVPRIGTNIALVAVALSGAFLLTGFTAPTLPQDSSAVYRFELGRPVDAGSPKSSTKMALMAETTISFPFVVVFNRTAVVASQAHRDVAKDMLEKLERALNSKTLSRGLEVAVERVYVPTSEIRLLVTAPETLGEAEAKTELSQALGSSADVSVSGEPARIRVVED